MSWLKKAGELMGGSKKKKSGSTAKTAVGAAMGGSTSGGSDSGTVSKTSAPSDGTVSKTSAPQTKSRVLFDRSVDHTPEEWAQRQQTTKNLAKDRDADMLEQKYWTKRRSHTIEGLDESKADALEQQRLATARSGAAGEVNSQLMQQLQAQTTGEAPSLAQAQLQQATDQNLAQQLAASQTRRATGGLAQRQALRAQSESGQQLAQQAGIQRLQEQQGAQQLLAQQVNQEQAQADGLTQKYMSMGFDMASAQQQAFADMEKLKAGIAKTEAESKAANNDSTMGLIGAGAGALAMMFSDKDKKKNIKSSKKDVKSFLDALSAKTYEYKDGKQQGAAEGQRYGILAQDLEKSEMGKSIVKDTENGKMVDTVQGFGAVLAAQSELNNRLKSLESKKKKKKKS